MTATTQISSSPFYGTHTHVFTWYNHRNGYYWNADKHFQFYDMGRKVLGNKSEFQGQGVFFKFDSNWKKLQTKNELFPKDFNL